MEKLNVKKEFVLEAYKYACKDWKLKIEEEFPELFKTSYDEERVYAYLSGGSIYKLHGSGGKFSFIDMDTSVCHANGHFNSPREALDSNSKEKIFSFDNQKDFFEWALKNC